MNLVPIVGVVMLSLYTAMVTPFASAVRPTPDPTMTILRCMYQELLMDSESKAIHNASKNGESQILLVKDSRSQLIVENCGSITSTEMEK